MLEDKYLVAVNFVLVLIIISLAITTPIDSPNDQTIVALSREKCPSGGCEIIKNEGNIDVLLERSGGSFTGAVILGVNKSLKIEEIENVKAEQNPFK